MRKSSNSQNDIVLYKSKDGEVKLEVTLRRESIWLSQKQMSLLFDKDTDTIGLHLKNIFESSELVESSTTEYFSVVQEEGGRNIKRKIKFYNLDAIISVGYRVNSKKGTQFRIWATNVLRKHIIEGYTINEKRLQQSSQALIRLQAQIRTLGKVVDNETFNLDEAKALMKIISEYSYSFELLDQVDNHKVRIPNFVTKQKAVRISFDDARIMVERLRENLSAGNLFGAERDMGLESALESIFQTFGYKDLYPSLEEKAANLLYLIIKNHPFIDGNKRIGSFMFVRFLDLNNLLYDSDGKRKIEDNTLVAIALMTAQSDPKDKDIMVKLIVNLIVGHG